MDAPVLYESPNLKIYIDESVPCLVNEWSGFVNGPTFREHILTLVDLLKQHSPHYGQLNMLADTRHLNVIAAEDVQWVSQHINPLYVKHGAAYEAFVLPKDAFGERAVKRYMRSSTSEGVFTVKLFDSMGSAKSWLKEVHGRPA